MNTDSSNNQNQLDSIEAQTIPTHLKWDIITSSYVDLSWKMVGGATQYNIYRSVVNADHFVKLETVFPTHGWLKPFFRDSQVTPGTTYYYKISSVNAQRESNLSEALGLMVTDYPALFKFDFGTETSPVAKGYTKVTNKTLYTKDLGYGFTDITKVDAGFREKTPESFGDFELVADFCLPKEMMESYCFKVDLPNGFYGLKLIAGDSTVGVPNRTDVQINGISVCSLAADRGKIDDKTFTAVITNGQMDITLSQNGRVNALEITPILQQPDNLKLDNSTLIPNPSITLSWNEVIGASSYNIYRGVTGEQTYSKIGYSENVHYTDEQVLPGTNYSYKVSAVTVNGESPQSNTINAAVLDTTIVKPSSPTNVSITHVDRSSVELTWECDATTQRYNIYRYTKDDSDQYTYIGTSASEIFNDHSVFTNVPHTYVVTALNAAGESKVSNAVVSKVAATAASPDCVTISDVTETSVKVNWATATGAISYNLYRSDFAEDNYSLVANTTDTFYTDATLSKGNSYNYKVTSVNAAGESVASKVILAMTKTDLTLLATLDLSAAGGGCRMRLGDLNGDGRMEILMVQPDYMGPESKDGVLTGRKWTDTYVPHAVQCLTAFDLDGNMLWQFGTPDPDVKGSGSDEPAQIYDIDDDGFNEVLCVMSKTTKDRVDGNPTIESRTEKFLILDGKTGTIKKEYDLPSAPATDHAATSVDPCTAHDTIIIANLTGTKKPQDIILKDRYSHLWAFDKDFNLLWTHTGPTGHYPWPYDLDGDGKDELVCCYDLISADGKVIWSCQDVSDHADCIWIGDLDGNPNNGKEIIIGGSATLVYNRFGQELWRNEVAIEPQQILVGNFQIDKPGLEIYGMDRIARGWDKFYGSDQKGRDCLYVVSSTGETLAREIPYDTGFTTATKLLRNWTGTYAPLTLSFKRGILNGEEIKPALHDGYLNVIAEIPVSTWTNVMIANICGDHKEEIITYENITVDGITKIIAKIYSNGHADLSSALTGIPTAQAKRDYNFTRYGSDEVDEIDALVPCNVYTKEITSSCITIAWTPVLGADFYNVYKADEQGNYIKVGFTKNASYSDAAILSGNNSYKVTSANESGESSKSISLAVLL